MTDRWTQCPAAPRGWLTSACCDDRGHYAKLDAIRYPPLDDAGDHRGGRDGRGGGLDTRVSAHVDDSLLTLLAHDHSAAAGGAAGAAGLQMLVPPTPGGVWCDVPAMTAHHPAAARQQGSGDGGDAAGGLPPLPPPPPLVIQLGAMMQRMSGDRWRATPHRVLCPPAGVLSDRLTLAFFLRPARGAVLELPLPPPSSTAAPPPPPTTASMPPTPTPTPPPPPAPARPYCDRRDNARRTEHGGGDDVAAGSKDRSGQGGRKGVGGAGYPPVTAGEFLQLERVRPPPLLSPLPLQAGAGEDNGVDHHQN
jgi:hypothetical protein